jgi:hypothetical protein
MSIFRCEICEDLFDADYEGCFEHPGNPFGCLCEKCSMDIEEQKENENNLKSTNES